MHCLDNCLSTVRGATFSTLNYKVTYRALRSRFTELTSTLQDLFDQSSYLI